MTRDIKASKIDTTVRIATEPVTPDVAAALTAAANEACDVFDKHLEPFGLTASDIAEPEYHRVIYDTTPQPERTEYHEWGYRLPAGTEVWAIDHGIDGIWTPAQRDLRIPHIDIYDGTEYDAIARVITPLGGEVIRARIVQDRHPTETVEPPQSRG